MCGICGIINLNDQTVEYEHIDRMLSLMSHRGPDDRGIYIKENIGLGMNRLAVIDLSLNAHQPMSNETQSVWIIYNGEIYNYKILRKELMDKGYAFKSNSDTEVVLHAYEEWGHLSIEQLNGMFAFAIFDKKKKELFIARDRLGIKPLYYAHYSDFFCFASEIKAILCYPRIQKTIDIQALDQYFSYMVIPHPKTIYKDINILEPGHTLTISFDFVKKTKYWDLNEQYLKVVESWNRDNAEMTISRKKVEEYYIDEVIKRLKKSVKMRMISDVPLGIFLSGGVDSSLVLALMSELSTEPVKTFSVGFEDGDKNYNELEYCRIVAKKFKTEHYEFIQKSDVNNVLPESIKHFDEPFANPTAIPMYYISKLARENVTVALSGVGGDELFGGYPRHVALQLINYKGLVPRSIQKVSLYILKKLQQSPNPYSFSDRAKRFFISI